MDKLSMTDAKWVADAQRDFIARHPTPIEDATSMTQSLHARVAAKINEALVFAWNDKDELSIAANLAIAEVVDECARVAEGASTKTNLWHWPLVTGNAVKQCKAIAAAILKLKDPS